jgi:hypothetical protein
VSSAPPAASTRAADSANARSLKSMRFAHAWALAEPSHGLTLLASSQTGT